MKLKKFDSINVIPFIDVLLVLLTIVLMTSTFISKGIIPVSLPSAISADKQVQNKEVNIIIKNDGNLYIDNVLKSLNDIQSQILTLSKETQININCDKDAKFEHFVTILDMLKKNEYSNISIVTKK